MSIFDEQLWREHAKSRHLARLTKNCEFSVSLAMFDDDIRHIQGISKLVDWLLSQKLAVRFTTKSETLYDPETNSVVVNVKLLPEKMLHSMLHEAGHILIGPRSTTQRYGLGYNAKKSKSKLDNLSHRIDVLDEELSAWNKGERLAKKLNIEINRKNFIRTRDKLVCTYIEWVIRVGPHSGLKDRDDNDTYKG